MQGMPDSLAIGLERTCQTIQKSDTRAKFPCVLGIDPGVSTGVAIARYEGDSYVYTTATCTTPEQVLDFISPALDTLIIERFSAQLISKYGLATVLTIGGVMALCRRDGVTVIQDTPTQRRPYLEYAKAQVPTRNLQGHHELRHEIDALAHVIRHLYQLGYITTLQVGE